MSSRQCPSSGPPDPQEIRSRFSSRPLVAISALFRTRLLSIFHFVRSRTTTNGSFPRTIDLRGFTNAARSFRYPDAWAIRWTSRPAHRMASLRVAHMPRTVSRKLRHLLKSHPLLQLPLSLVDDNSGYNHHAFNHHTRPSERMPITNAPMIVPPIVPRPPDMEVPPRTAAAMAFNSNDAPTAASSAKPTPRTKERKEHTLGV
jgi:hypothetical protein